MSVCGILISSDNLSGLTANVVYFPESGGTIDLGTQVMPFIYNTDYYYGTYSCYVPIYNYTYDLVIAGPTPTPTTTSTVTPTNTQTKTPTVTPTNTTTPTTTPTIGTSQPQTPTNTSTPTVTPTITPSSGGFNRGPFTFDFDYMLCEYYFTDGVDMDTVSYMTVPSIMESNVSDPNAIGPVNGKYYNYVGTCAASDSGPQFPLSPATPFLTYGGDNRESTGTESVLFDLIEFKTQNPGTVNIEFSFTADWYTTPGTNPIYMRATLWKGGTPVQVGFTWENTTATGTYLVESNGTVTTLNVQDCQPYELVSNFQYNISNFQGQFI